MGTSEFNAGGNRACDGVASHRAGGGRGVKILLVALCYGNRIFFPRSAEKSSRKKKKFSQKFYPQKLTLLAKLYLQTSQV